MRAYCLVRPQPWYRRDAFVSGLKNAGYHVQSGTPDRITPDTVLVLWNRYADQHALAERVEKGGGRVLIAENGYLGIGGSTPKFDVYGAAGNEQHHYFAIAEGWHNGGGRWPWPGADGERWKKLRIQLKPWRQVGKHILICPNRSFGVPGRMMHPDWAARLQAKLVTLTKREVRVRIHPGNGVPKVSLRSELRDAWCVFVWSSSAGVHALIEGIPVFCDSPYWVLKGAASMGDLESPTMPDRLPHFERLAWAQWSTEEIATGEPFRHLLHRA